ncbi:MAG: transcriptional regulator [Clostridia bacterium]|jgi:DNA-binding response OmpR family regulator|uniref:response regulator transcription factor n=1 Tax=Petroclostridium xylanilyticum TaxID=1792311 RepID=UPI000B98B4C0|nr:response regulator transcription factor [Petroclostridium xylanilyticum]MBZ4647449.1 transcriptional regulator [Clostridia bacterium]
MSGVKILIADDEARMRKLVSDFLKREGYSVMEAEDGKRALELFYSEQNFDLVILDIMMPELDGWSVCRRIRENSRIPIIMLTARSEEADELLGFNLGADEYITKPFSPMILVARVKALLRRLSNGKRDVKLYDGLKIDETGHVVYVDEKIVDLSPKEFELLVYFTDNEGIALSREQILNSVWDYDYFGDARTVDTHVKKLRLKLGDKGDYIQTVRGLGYKFEVKK